MPPPDGAAPPEGAPPPDGAPPPAGAPPPDGADWGLCHRLGHRRSRTDGLLRSASAGPTPAGSRPLRASVSLRNRLVGLIGLRGSPLRNGSEGAAPGGGFEPQATPCQSRQRCIQRALLRIWQPELRTLPARLQARQDLCSWLLCSLRPRHPRPAARSDAPAPIAPDLGRGPLPGRRDTRTARRSRSTTPDARAKRCRRTRRPSRPSSPQRVRKHRSARAICSRSRGHRRRMSASDRGRPSE